MCGTQSHCNKCHQYTPLGNDSWCLGCTGVEALQGELAAPWRTPGFRAAANDLVVSAVRGVKALRDLSQSVYSAEQSQLLHDRFPARPPRRRPLPLAQLKPYDQNFLRRHIHLQEGTYLVQTVRNVRRKKRTSK